MNDNAKNALHEYHEKLRNGEITKVVTTPVEKLKKNPTSLRLAVNAMCFQCMGCSSTNAADVRNCTSISCALYEVRPYK